ncbi:MAG TPA: PIG-L family deacetylase [Candidatus Hydrogenedentes bacterium]|nr:PIG-L family deacetylase [Candidatus Hydrogenedentota bacterium]HRT21039.1 PIG-L family deacetylase [Candidatus Hydrogenedentota bacterium]HRT65868.1 PIG-L family deacetylase [Candidatus Hydrogenedentota bacterium]
MNIVVVGAHPDDAEVFAGGACVKWARLGHRVLMVSLTNGDVGHHEMAGGPLAMRRAAEAHLSAERAGVRSLVLDHHDGELEPTLALRKQVVGILREFEADIVLTHRPNDYHPDHRYTSVVVQDAAFMVTVPHFCPLVPALGKNPVFLYLMDSFQKPVPFRPDIAVDVSDAMDTKWAMLDAMESQMYEWLPWLDGALQTVPGDAAARREWLERTWTPFFETPAKQARKALEKWYGPSAAKIRFAEIFEICEYGHQPSEQEIRRLFPFFPAATARRRKG